MEKRTEFLCNRISSCVNDHGLGRNQRNLRSSRFIRVRGSGMSGLPARELTSLNFIFATDLWSYWIGYSQRRSAACFSQQFPSLLSARIYFIKRFSFLHISFAITRLFDRDPVYFHLTGESCFSPRFNIYRFDILNN